jgi:hypothetical protein
MLVRPDNSRVSAPLKILRMVIDGLKAIPISCILECYVKAQNYIFSGLNRFWQSKS